MPEPQMRRPMSPGTIELPLFPLNVVLFPGMVLPLHIFEPRYRQMITECRKLDKPFGVVLTRPEGRDVTLPPSLREDTYAVGTTAEIRELDELEDGRFILMAIGVQRFHILSRHRRSPIFLAWSSHMRTFLSRLRYWPPLLNRHSSSSRRTSLCSWKRPVKIRSMSICLLFPKSCPTSSPTFWVRKTSRSSNCWS